ncbi:hypothetical protein PYCC9005_003758 [Savitreella phatthalungensis]
MLQALNSSFAEGTVPVLAPIHLDGSAAYRRTVAKYYIEPTLMEAQELNTTNLLGSSLYHIKAAAGVGIAASTAVKDSSQWLTEAAIGQPKQNIRLNFDTGSSDFWVFSTDMPASERQGQSAYAPTNSRSSVSANPGQASTWNITYADKSGAAGVVGHDTLWLGGIAVKSQAVQRASFVSQDFFSDASATGLLGLAFGKLNTVKPQRVATPMENLIAQGRLAQPLFTAKLVDGTVAQGSGGHFTFGFIDQDAFVGQLSYTPVDTSAGFWEVNSPYLRIGRNGVDIPRPGALSSSASLAKRDGQPSSPLAPTLASLVPGFARRKGSCGSLSTKDAESVSKELLSWGQQIANGLASLFGRSPSSRDRSSAASGLSVFDGSMQSGLVPQHSAIIDTGTTLMLVDDETVLTIHQQVKGATYSKKHGGYLVPCKAQLPDLFFMIGSAYHGVPGASLAFAPVEDNMCFSGIQSRGTMDRDIYGDVFLKNNYVVFLQQAGSEQIGIGWRPDILPKFAQ